MERCASTTTASGGGVAAESRASAPQSDEQEQTSACTIGSVRTGFSLAAPASTNIAQAPVLRAVVEPVASVSSLAGGATSGVARLTVRVEKKGERLGFGVRHDRSQRLVVSKVGGPLALREGDTLVSVNGVALSGPDFSSIVERLKAIPPGTLIFDIERSVAVPRQATVTSSGANLSAVSKASAATSPPGVNHARPVMAGGGSVVVNAGLQAALPAPITLNNALAPSLLPAPPVCLQASELPGQPPAKKPRVSSSSSNSNSNNRSSILGSTSASPAFPASINGSAPLGTAVGMPAATLTPEKKPPTVNALMKEVERQRAEKKALESKSAALRKRLQQMLIECGEVRVRANAEVQAVKDKAQHEVEEAQRALTAARAQLRLANRAPDVGRSDSIAVELEAARSQLEKLRKTEAERTALFNARYLMESRLAECEARRVLDALVADGCAQLRVLARRHAAGNSAASAGGLNGAAASDGNAVTVTREGVRRLAFLKLFGLRHDLSLYMSPSFQSLDVVRHEVGREQLAELFGSAMRHEERAGLFYVAAGPMDVAFDPRTETLTLKCGWTEQNAIRDLARSLRVKN